MFSSLLANDGGRSRLLLRKSISVHTTTVSISRTLRTAASLVTNNHQCPNLTSSILVSQHASYSNTPPDKNMNNNEGTTSTKSKIDKGQFRPRRRTTLNFRRNNYQPPKVNKESKNAIQIPHDSNKPHPVQSAEGEIDEEGVAQLERLYGETTTDALRFLSRAKAERGSPLALPSVETILRGADYLTAVRGSTEDLVGERRADMDAWTQEQRESFTKGLEASMEMEEERNFREIWAEGSTDLDELETEKNPMSQVKDEDEEKYDRFYDPNQKAFGPWAEMVVRVDRVQKVQRGGTLVRYRALVIGGNTNGCAGFGVAKANAPNDATVLASKMARRNIFFVDRYNNAGLTTDLAGKHNSCKVLLRSVRPEYGLRGHPLILEILKFFGIADCSAKSYGNRNIYSVVRATFKALCTHQSMEDIAFKRGKRLLTLERAKRLQI